MRVTAMVVSHRRRGAEVERGIATLVRLMDAEQIPYALFKGQTLAALYPDPALRSTGDVDFYVPPTHFALAEQVIEHRLGVRIDRDESDKHHAFTHEGVLYEIHFMIERFGCARHQRRYGQMVALSLVTRTPSALHGVTGLSLETELVTVVKHIMGHLLTEGVGLRQLCDLAMLCHRRHRDYDATELAQALGSVGYLRSFRALGATLVRHLRLPEAEFPLPLAAADYRWADRIMGEVMGAGNFGRKRRKTRDAGLRRSAETARVFLSAVLRFFPLAPAETLGIVPWRLGLTARKLLHG